jgi:DNA-binding transcriptional ArsR family regulator
MAYIGGVQAVLNALVEPRRREILRLVRDEELTAGSIASRFPDVARPTVSQHLKVLRGAGLVAERREGTRRFYRARPDALAELHAFVAGFWDNRLAALQRALDEEKT